MENRNYKININEGIYVGQVVSTDNIYQYQRKTLFLQEWTHLRNMLFILNENKQANDLLYNSPNYSILNVTDKKFITKESEEFILIQNSINLSPLLEFIESKEYLSYNDIIRVCQIIFDEQFVLKNKHLFEDILPEEYLQYLPMYSCKSYFQSLKDHQKRNTFTPTFQEGPIRKLKK